MAKEIDSKMMDKLVAFVKKEGFGNYSYQDACNASGVEYSQIGRYLYAAELKAFPNLKIPATGKAIVKARKDGTRIPRIAVFAGISESKVKELYEAETGEDIKNAYTGRGRKWDPNATTVKSGTSGRRTGGSASKASSKKTAAASSGRRASAKTKTASAPAAGRKPGRRTTRAAAAADPK